MASTNAFLTLYSTVQTNLVGSTITTGFIPYISTAGRQAYSNTLSTLTVSTLTTTNVNTSTMVTSTISGVAAPTVKLITTPGSGSYTPLAGVVRIRVRMCGPGGGGSSSTGGNVAGSPAANAGQRTEFGSWTAGYGTGGIVNGYGGYCYTTGTTNGTGTLIMRVQGGSGQGASSAPYIAGGSGGVNPFGGGGGGGPWGASVVGYNGAPSTGAGGGGGGAAASGSYSGSGGGAGEYVEFYVYNPTTTSVFIPSGGVGGQAGNWGGNGGSGVIIVEEFYY